MYAFYSIELYIHKALLTIGYTILCSCMRETFHEGLCEISIHFRISLMKELWWEIYHNEGFSLCKEMLHWIKTQRISPCGTGKGIFLVKMKHSASIDAPVIHIILEKGIFDEKFHTIPHEMSPSCNCTRLCNHLS